MLERDLVDECRSIAEACGAFLALVGQRKAKGSGSTIGFPDALLIDSGEVVLIELKRPKTADNPHGNLSVGQRAFIERAAEHGVGVRVVDSADAFVGCLNWCRRPRGVTRSSR